MFKMKPSEEERLKLALTIFCEKSSFQLFLTSSFLTMRRFEKNYARELKYFPNQFDDNDNGGDNEQNMNQAADHVGDEPEKPKGD